MTLKGPKQKLPRDSSKTVKQPEPLDALCTLEA